MIEITEDMVRRELRKETTPEEEEAMLASPAEWRGFLVGFKKDVELQMSQKRSESVEEGTFEAKQQYEAWKKSANYYKSVVEKRIIKVKNIITKRNQEEYAERASANGKIDYFPLMLEEMKETNRLLRDILEELSEQGVTT